MQFMQNYRRRLGGSAVLELALLLPLLLALTFGLCSWGLFFYIQHNLQGAAREGARAGIPFNAVQADASGKVSNYLTNAGLNPGDFTISFSHDVGSAAPGTDITVTIQGVWSNVGVSLLPPALGGIAGDKVVRGRAVMRKEG